MGLLDGSMQQQQPQQQMGGLLGGMPMGGQGAAPGGAPQAGGVLPPEMMQMIQQVKSADPQKQQQFIQHVVQQIQTSGKAPEMVQQAIQEFMGAMQQ